LVQQYDVIENEQTARAHQSNKSRISRNCSIVYYE
jgi:hypothetical protein